MINAFIFTVQEFELEKTHLLAQGDFEHKWEY